jgi:hypothetical protein
MCRAEFFSSKTKTALAFQPARPEFPTFAKAMADRLTADL